MKLMHLADLHIGKRVNEFSMIDDQKYILNQILHIAENENVDGIIIAGDVYDKSVPAAEAVTLLDSFISSISAMNIQLFIISGNHDSAERLSFATNILENSNIYISPVFDGNIKKCILSDTYGKLNIYLLPFIKPINVKTAYELDQSMSYSEAVKYVIEKLDINKKERNIIISHQFVTGAQTCDSEDITVGGIDNVDANVYADFDYTALGHIHKPQAVGTDTVRYCGTPLKYSFSEAKHEKSVTVVDFEKKGDITINLHSLKPLHDMVEIKGEFDKITSPEFYKEYDTNDYFHITLTDEDEIIDFVAKLRNIYPNVMKIDYDNSRTRLVNIIETDTDGDKKTPEQLFSDLYELQNNSELNDNQLDYIKNLVNEIWCD